MWTAPEELLARLEAEVTASIQSLPCLLRATARLALDQTRFAAAVRSVA